MPFYFFVVGKNGKWKKCLQYTFKIKIATWGRIYIWVVS